MVHYCSRMRSGQRRVVAREMAALRARGHCVHSVERVSGEPAGWLAGRRPMTCVPLVVTVHHHKAPALAVVVD